MSAWSIPPIATASIALYVGLYHLSIYLRRKHHREDLTFALMCLTAVLYCVFCAGLYSATSVAEGAQWQRAQFIALALFVSSFLWFAHDYTHQRPAFITYGLWLFYLIAIFVQAIDRSALTWTVDDSSIKHIVLPFGSTITYYEATMGPFSTVHGLVGLAAASQIVWTGIRYYRSGHRREAIPLLFALALMYVAAINDTAVSNSLYPFIYILEYVYLAMIVLMAYSLSGTVVNAAMTKEALQKSEERLKLAMEAVSDGLFDWNMQTGEVYFSSRYYTMLGYEPYELPQSDATWANLLHPDDKEYALNTVGEYGKGQRRSHEIETRLRTKSGEWRWILSRGRIVEQGSGGAIRLIGTHIDITERKQSEKALHESELLLRKSQTVGRIGSFQVDVRTGKIISSPVVEEIYGIDESFPRDIDGWLSLIHPEQREEMAHYLRQHVLAEHNRLDKEFRIIRHSDQQERWLYSLGELEFDSQGSPVRLIGISQDITERRQAEAALRESREILRLVLDSIPVRVFWKDRESVYLGCNRPFASDTGLASPDDIIGKNDYMLLPWVKQADQYRSDDRHVMETGTPKMGYEELHGEVSSQQRWLRTSKVPLRDAQGNVAGVLGIFEDITESKRQARLLQESEDRLVKAQALAHVGNWEIDLGSQTMWGSDESLRIYGVDQSTPVLPLKTVQDCALPEFRPALDKAMHDLIAGERGYAEDFQITRIDNGEVRYVYSTAECVRNETGRPVKIIGVIQDITERKQAEAALQKSGDLLKAIIEAAPTPIIGLDLDGKVHTVWNRAAENMLGWSAEEVMGRFLPSVPTENAEEFRQLYERIGAGDNLNGVEVQRQRRDGTPIEYSVYASPLHDAEGKVTGNVTVLVDITERNRSDKALRESQGNLQTLFDALNDFLFILDPRGQIVHFNPVVLKRLGYSAGELKGKGMVELHPPDQRQEATEIIADMLAGKRSTCSLPLMTRDGELIPVDTKVSHGTWSGSDALFGISRDLTALRKMEQREELAYEVGRQLTRLLDLDVLLAETILRLKDAFGYYHVQIYLLDTTLQQLVLRVATGEAGDRLLREGHRIPLNTKHSLVARAARTRKPVVATDARQHPDHLPNPLLEYTRSEAALSLTVGDKVLGVLDIQHDVIGHFDEAETRTLQIVASQISVALSNAQLFEEVRCLNEDLERRVYERTAQLEAANKEIEAFAYSVSHDLRAPLRSIDGFSQAILEDYGHTLDHEGHDQLQRVRAASQRMGQLIDGLLMLSRITRQEMQHETVDLTRLAHDIMDDLQQSDPDRKVKISIARGMTISGDANLIRVALSNLLANAWKFTSKQPDASIRFYRTDRDGEHVFAIQDNGAGFEMKYVGKLFGAFQRLHHKDEYEGTGIGLATVQRIIHRHNGRIWAEAEIDKGATFYFTLSVS